MLTRNRFQPPILPEDWRSGGPELVRVLSEYFLSLEQKGALAIQPIDISNLPVFNVEDYMVPGSRDITRPMSQIATALIAAGGGIIEFGKGKSYTAWTGAAASQTVMLTLSSAVNACIIKGNGATITSARSDANYGDILFYTNGANNVEISGLTFVGGNTQTKASSAIGEYFVYVDGGSRNVYVQGNTIKKCLAGYSCQGTSSQQLGAHFINNYCELVFYPLTLYNTTVARADYVSRNCGRTAVVQAPCQNIRIRVDSESSFTSTDVILVVYANSGATNPDFANALTDIEVDYSTKGRTDQGSNNASDGIIILDFRQGSGVNGACIFRDIRLKYNVNAKNNADQSDDTQDRLLNILRRNYDGTADNSTRNHVLEGLDISGTAINWDAATGDGLRLFDTTYTWTGDVLSGIKIHDFRMEGAAGGSTAIRVNGQGAVSGAPFLTLDNVYVDGDYTTSNMGSASVAIRHFKAANFSLFGAWTPVITFGGASTGITYSSQTGSYRDDGQVIEFWGTCALTNKGSATGTAKIGGLPVTSRNNDDSRAPVSLYMANTTFANQFMAWVELNATTVALEEVTEAGTATVLTDADFSNTSTFYIHGRYRR